MRRSAMTRRDEGEYRQYVTEEQRRQAGYSAGRMQLGFHHELPVSRHRSMRNDSRTFPVCMDTVC